MFLPPGACTGVVSPIKAGDWCHEFTAKKKGFTSSLLQITAAPKCPHCGSTDYGLMPSDFETAKCNKCGKNWDHGIVPGVNDPSEKSAAGRGSGIRGDEAVNFYKPTTTLPPRYDQRTHIDKNNLDNPVIDDMKADKKKMEEASAVLNDRLLNYAYLL